LGCRFRRARPARSRQKEAAGPVLGDSELAISLLLFDRVERDMGMLTLVVVVQSIRSVLTCLDGKKVDVEAKTTSLRYSDAEAAATETLISFAQLDPTN
jgi:hypothetical protein